MSNELIQIVDCLTEEQVARCLEILDDAPWEPTTVFFGAECKVDNNIRSNYRYCLDNESEVAKIMHEGMNAALLTYRDVIMDIHPELCRHPIPGTVGTKCWRETIQVLKYEKAEYYTWHTDRASDKTVNENNRTMSVVLYLKNATVGGRTQFTHRFYRPKAGQALIFPSSWNYPHQGEAVEEGTKIAAVTWYHSDYE